MKKIIKKAQSGATRQPGTDAKGKPHPIVDHIDRKPASNSKVVTKSKSQSQISSEKRFTEGLSKDIKERAAYNKVKEKTGEVRTLRNPTQPTLASMGFLNKTKNTKSPNPVLKALVKKNGGKIKKKK